MWGPQQPSVDWKDRRVQGSCAILVGVWILGFTWALYSKYSRTRRNVDNPGAPLVQYVLASLVVVAGVMALLVGAQIRRADDNGESSASSAAASNGAAP